MAKTTLTPEKQRQRALDGITAAVRQAKQDKSFPVLLEQQGLLQRVEAAVNKQRQDTASPLGSRIDTLKKTMRISAVNIICEEVEAAPQSLKPEDETAIKIKKMMQDYRDKFLSPGKDPSPKFVKAEELYNQKLGVVKALPWTDTVLDIQLPSRKGSSSFALMSPESLLTQQGLHPSMAQLLSGFDVGEVVSPPPQGSPFVSPSTSATDLSLHNAVTTMSTSMLEEYARKLLPMEGPSPSTGLSPTWTGYSSLPPSTSAPSLSSIVSADSAPKTLTSIEALGKIRDGLSPEKRSIREAHTALKKLPKEIRESVFLHLTNIINPQSLRYLSRLDFGDGAFLEGSGVTLDERSLALNRTIQDFCFKGMEEALERGVLPDPKYLDYLGAAPDSIYNWANSICYRFTVNALGTGGDHDALVKLGKEIIAAAEKPEEIIPHLKEAIARVKSKLVDKERNPGSQSIPSIKTLRSILEGLHSETMNIGNANATLKTLPLEIQESVFIHLTNIINPRSYGELSQLDFGNELITPLQRSLAVNRMIQDLCFKEIEKALEHGELPDTRYWNFLHEAPETVYNWATATYYRFAVIISGPGDYNERVQFGKRTIEAAKKPQEMIPHLKEAIAIVKKDVVEPARALPLEESPRRSSSSSSSSSSRVSSSSSSSSSTSSRAPARVSKPTAPPAPVHIPSALFSVLDSLQTISDRQIKEGSNLDAFNALVALTQPIRTIFNEERAMPIKAFVFSHLFNIHDKPPRKVESDDDLYAQKAFLNQGGFSSTPAERHEIIRRTQVEIALHGLREAIEKKSHPDIVEFAKRLATLEPAFKFYTVYATFKLEKLGQLKLVRPEFHEGWGQKDLGGTLNKDNCDLLTMVAGQLDQHLQKEWVNS